MSERKEFYLSWYLSAKSWVAEVKGADRKYGWSREFIRPALLERSCSGRTGTATYLLEVGKVYEIQPAYKSRRLVIMEESGPKDIGPEEALQILEGLKGGKDGN